MCVRGGTKIISSLLVCQIIFATCSPFRSGNPDFEISSQLTNCKNVIYFPNVEYPVLASNIGLGNQCGYDNTQNYGPFRPKTCVAQADEEDESYKDPKWWKTFAQKLKSSNKATEPSDTATISSTTNSIQAQKTFESTSQNTATAASQAVLIDDITSSNQSPEVIKPVVASTDKLANFESLPFMSNSVQSAVISSEPKSNLLPLSTTLADFPELLPLTEGTLESLTSTPSFLQNSSPIFYLPVSTSTSLLNLENSETLSSIPSEVLDSIPITLPSNVDQGFVSTFSDAENNQLNTLEDVNTAVNQNDLSPLDSVASAITNLILNPSSVQKRTPTNETSISEKASFVWMAIPYVDENSTASVIPLVVLKFPPIAINNSLSDNSTIEKIVVDSLKKQDVQDIISATKIKEALLNKTISVADYYKPLSDNYDSVLELTNRTEANVTTTDNTYAFLVDKSNSTSLLIDKIKNEVIKSKEVKPDSIAFYVNDLVENTSENLENNTKPVESNEQEQNSTKNIDKPTVAEKKPKYGSESGEYFKTIVIKIIRKSDNLTDPKQIDIGDANYKTDNLVIQIIDEKSDV